MDEAEIKEAMELDTTPPALKRELAEMLSPEPEPDPTSTEAPPVSDPVVEPQVVVEPAPEPKPEPEPKPTEVPKPAPTEVPPVADPVSTPGPVVEPEPVRKRTLDGLSSDSDSGLQKQLTASEQAKRVIQGKYDAELPRALQEKKDLEQEVERLKSQNADLQQQAASRPVDYHTLSDDEFSSHYGISLEQLDSNGRDYWEGIVQVSEHASERTRVALDERLDERLETVYAQQETQAEIVDRETKERYLASVLKLMPNADTVVESPEFDAWLDSTPAYDRVMEESIHDRDARAVVDVVKYFLSTHPEFSSDAVDPGVPIDSQVTPLMAATPPAEPAAPSRMSIEEEVEKIASELTQRRGTMAPGEIEKKEKRLSELVSVLES